MLTDKNHECFICGRPGQHYNSSSSGDSLIARKSTLSAKLDMALSLYKN